MNALQTVLKASLESQQMDAQAELLRQSDEAAYDPTAVSDAYIDASVAVDDFAEADDAYAALEQIAIALEAQREEGLSSQSALFLNLGLQQQYSRVGMEGRLDLPSLETFAHGRMATVLSIETVGQRVQQFWQYLKEQFLKALNAVRTFIKSLFNNKAQNEAAAQKIEAALPQLPETASTESVALEFRGGATVTLSEASARKLHLNGQLEDVVSGLRKSVDYCQAMAQEGASIEHSNDKFGRDMIALLNTQDTAAFNTQLEKIVDGLPVPQPKNHPHVTNDGDVEVCRSNQMVGGVTFVIRRAKLHPSDEGVVALRKKVGGIKLTRIDAVHERVDTAIAPMTRAQGDQVIACVRDVIKLADQLDATAKQIDSDEKAFQGALDHVSPSLQGEHARQMAAAVREFMKASMNLLMRDGILLRYSSELVRACEEWALRSAR